MDLIGIIRDLRDEREKLEQIIKSLEQLQIVSTKLPVPGESRVGRRSMDAEARMEVSRRMKKYWASRRRDKSANA
ncbi:MAG: hypothetical protein JWO80_4803 [Bryobacterales bacterium]|jgi:hypothetical protein|nr:hypothetical protein [Bryobacterales bacterium]